MAKNSLSLVEGLLKDREKPKPAVAGFSVALLRERQDEMTKRMDAMLGTMNDTLAFLRMAPQEQAKREAEPLLQEAREKQAAIEKQMAALEVELAKPRSNPKETTKLRAMLREADAEASVLRTRGTQHEQEIQALKQAGDKAEAEHQKSLAAARNQVPQIVQQMPGKPENIDFVYHRERNGLLSRVILKAEGYNDVEVGVVRGADGRMQQLKIGEA